MPLKEGDTFLYRYPRQEYHLFLVVTNITSFNGKVQYVCTMVSTWKEKSKLCDPACILDKEDHPFIVHKSYIAYQETVLFPEDMLTELLAIGRAILKEPLALDVLSRIKASAKNSDMISPMMLEYYK